MARTLAFAFEDDMSREQSARLIEERPGHGQGYGQGDDLLPHPIVLLLFELLPAGRSGQVSDQASAGLMNGNLDILLLVPDVRCENGVAEPFLAWADRIEGLAEKGVLEYELAHLFFIVPIGTKAAYQNIPLGRELILMDCALLRCVVSSQIRRHDVLLPVKIG